MQTPASISTSGTPMLPAPTEAATEAAAFLAALDARRVRYRLEGGVFRTKADRLTDDEALRLGSLIADLEALLAGRPTCKGCLGLIRSTVFEVTWMDRERPETDRYHEECVPHLTKAGLATRSDLRPRADVVTFWQGPCRCIWCDKVATHPKEAEMPMTCAGCSRRRIRPAAGAPETAVAA